MLFVRKKLVNAPCTAHAYHGREFRLVLARTSLFLNISKWPFNNSWSRPVPNNILLPSLHTYGMARATDQLSF